MSSDKLRRRIASEAARLLYTRQVVEYHSAKLRAARQLLGGNVRAEDLPTNREVLDEFNARGLEHQAQQDAANADGRDDDWRATILPIDGQLPDEVRFDAPSEPRPNLAGGWPRSVDSEALENRDQLDRFHMYQLLLAPLEQVKQNTKRHPEGDALYHSLQVFTLARETLPYDEEFLLAALLHDVGKAIARRGRARRIERLHHAAHGLADRASTRGTAVARRNARRTMPAPAGRPRRL
jgi:hypothetical protein